MNAKVKPFFRTEPILQEIATVAMVTDGKAIQISIDGGSERIAVVGHRHGIPALKTDDRVLITRTANGPVVMDRLLGENEPPAPVICNEDGKLLLKADGGVSLVCGDSRIEITRDGRIHINGKEVSTFSVGRLKLQGSTIELN